MDGDVRTFDGTASLIQAADRTALRQEEHVIGKRISAIWQAMKKGRKRGGYAIVQRTFKPLLRAGASDWKWKRALVPDGAHCRHADFSVGTGKGRPRQRRLELGCGRKEPRQSAAAQWTELVLYTDRKVYDGRFANNWLAARNAGRR